MTLLAVEDLRAAYGDAPALFGVSFALREGEALALLGRNGTGKTTTVSAILGIVRPTGGTVRIRGTEVTGQPPFRVARHGIGLVPEGRQIFPTLSVEENLVATARPGPWTLARAWQLFPRLLERRRTGGTLLSGGEQQMLAIARALLTNPALLILDEATEGLAPTIRAEIWSVLASLKKEGQSLLVVDKNLSALLALADHAVVLQKGRSVWSGTATALAAAPGTRAALLGV